MWRQSASGKTPPESRIAGLFRFTIDSYLHAVDLRKRKLALKREPLRTR